METNQTGSMSSKECLKEQNSGPSFSCCTLMIWPITPIQTLKEAKTLTTYYFLQPIKTLPLQAEPLKHKSNICAFISKKNLQLNVLKTEFLILSEHANFRNFKMSIKVGGKTIHASKSMKDLGISMDFDMSFQLQINATLRNLANSFRTLHQVRKSCPSKTQLVLLKTLILSHLEYRVLFYTSCFKTQIKSLDR